MAIAVVTNAGLGLMNPIANNGGYPVRLSGIEAGTFRVHLGPNGSSADPVCYSGVSGRAEEVVVGDDGIANLVAPPLPVSPPSHIFYFVRLKGTGSATQTSTALLSVVPHTFSGRTYSLRQLFPSLFDAGSRRQRQEKFPQT